jgi:hypothetical protein
MKIAVVARLLAKGNMNINTGQVLYVKAVIKRKLSVGYSVL